MSQFSLGYAGDGKIVALCCTYIIHKGVRSSCCDSDGLLSSSSGPFCPSHIWFGSGYVSPWKHFSWTGGALFSLASAKTQRFWSFPFHGSCLLTKDIYNWNPLFFENLQALISLLRLSFTPTRQPGVIVNSSWLASLFMDKEWGRIWLETGTLSARQENHWWTVQPR